MKNNRNLFIIAVIAVVNALGYGIIIPVLYSYSQKFGLSDFDNGLLFSIFSLAQFFATPLIGRLSDKYGRRPLLLISLIGTAVSFLIMALAQNGWMLFAARFLDGITAGNLPVAQAVISDTTKPEERAKGFGIIGAAFGFGFVVGPALSALTVGFGDAIPFYLAAIVSVIAVLLIAFLLPETNQHLGEVKKGKLFDFKHLVQSLFDPAIGKTLAITLLYSFAISLLIYGYQPFSVKILHLSATAISINFAVFGLMGLIAQMFLIPRAIKWMNERLLLRNSLLVAVVTFSAFFFARTPILFTLVTVVHALVNAFINPLTQTLLSKEVDAKSQGSILGLGAAYMSVGMIVGPILGGTLATVSIPLPFLVGGMISLLCAYLAQLIIKTHFSHQSAF